MIDGISNGRIVLSAVSQRYPAALLLVVLLLLGMTACGGTTAPDTPANQRYWHDVDEFAVLHWEASLGAEYYKIYYGDCSKEYPCTLLGESRSTTAAAFVGAADFDHNLYVVACNGSACSDDITHSSRCHDRRGEASGLSCSRISPNDTADPAQRLMTPDGTTPPTPSDFKGKKIIRSSGYVDFSPDDVAITWNEVDGATWYELWIGSGPSSDFRLGKKVPGHGLDGYDGYRSWKDYLSTLDTPVNRGSWGEYAITSWKVRACTMAGCSPFSDIVTIE